VNGEPNRDSVVPVRNPSRDGEADVNDLQWRDAWRESVERRRRANVGAVKRKKKRKPKRKSTNGLVMLGLLYVGYRVLRQATGGPRYAG